MLSALLMLALQSAAPAPAPDSDEPGRSAERTSAAATPEEFSLGVGTQRVVTLPGPIKAVALGTPAVVDARPLGDRQLLTVGLKKGTSSLLVFLRDGTRRTWRVTVRNKDPGTDEWQYPLEQALAPCTESELKIEGVGDKVVIDGSIGSVDDLDVVLRLQAEHPSIVVLARLTPAALAKRVAEVNGLLAQQGLTQVRAQAVGRTVILDGAVADDNDLRRAEAIARDRLGPFFEAKAAKTSPEAP